jgi:hypothetical protein
MRNFNFILFFVGCTSVICAPTDSITTNEITQIPKNAFPNTELNEVNGKLLTEEATNSPDTTESPSDPRFDIDEGLTVTPQPSLQMQIPETSDAPDVTKKLDIVTANNDDATRVYNAYQDILQSQIFRTFYTLLTELQKSQLHPTPQQEVHESQVIETSMPYFNPSEYKNDDVNGSGDDDKVIVFDENSGKYVYLDRKLLMQDQQDESHVSIIFKE